MKPLKIIIHHTAVSYDTHPIQFSLVNDYHRLLWDFKSALNFYCGYGWFIEKDGTIIQARLDTEEQAHTQGQNNVAIGIALAGNFDYERPTLAQTIALKNLILKKMEEYSIPVSNIFRHQDFANKSCCGKFLPHSKIQELIKIIAPKEPVKPIEATPEQISYFQNILNSLKILLNSLLNKTKVGRIGSESSCVDLNSNK